MIKLGGNFLKNDSFSEQPQELVYGSVIENFYPLACIYVLDILVGCDLVETLIW